MYKGDISQTVDGSCRIVTSCNNAVNKPIRMDKITAITGKMIQACSWSGKNLQNCVTYV